MLRNLLPARVLKKSAYGALFAVFLLPFSLQAEPTATSFATYVTFHRVQRTGSIDSLRIRNDRPFSFREFAKRILHSVRKFHGDPTLTHDVSRLLQEELQGESLNLQQQELLADALTAIEKTDFDKIERDPKFQKLIGVYDEKLAERFLEQNVIAQLYDPKFFYNSQWRKTLMEWAIAIAQTVGGFTPGVNLAIYMFEKALDDLITRRAFYQNFTLYHLLAFRAADLGLTATEARLALSSIYEAQLTWYQGKTSDQAQRNWKDFGAIRMTKDRATCDARLARYRAEYEPVGAPLNFVFYPATHSSHAVIINTRNARSKIDHRPSLALHLSKPTHLRNVRSAFELVLLGLNLAPVPGPAQAVFRWFLESHYIPQIRSEGALFAHLESSGAKARARTVIKQSVNPFLLLEVQ